MAASVSSLNADTAFSIRWTLTHGVNLVSFSWPGRLWNFVTAPSGSKSSGAPTPDTEPVRTFAASWSAVG